MFNMLKFFPRDDMLYIARVYSYGPESVCHKSLFYKTGMNGLIWFSAWRLLSTSPTLCFKEIQVSTKIRVYFPLELFSKLWTWKMIRHGISIVKRAINLAR